MLDHTSSVIETDRRRYMEVKHASINLFNALVREHPRIVTHLIENAKKYKEQTDEDHRLL
jgi:hypothetical protein